MYNSVWTIQFDVGKLPALQYWTTDKYSTNSSTNIGYIQTCKLVINSNVTIYIHFLLCIIVQP